MPASLPDSVVAYAESPHFTEETLPEKLRSLHALKAGTWGKLMVLEGALDYLAPDSGEPAVILRAGDWLAIPPEISHCVKPLGVLRCKIVFHREPGPTAAEAPS